MQAQDYWWTSQNILQMIYIFGTMLFSFLLWMANRKSAVVAERIADLEEKRQIRQKAMLRKIVLDNKGKVIELLNSKDIQEFFKKLPRTPRESGIPMEIASELFDLNELDSVVEAWGSFTNLLYSTFPQIDQGTYDVAGNGQEVLNNFKALIPKFEAISL